MYCQWEEGGIPVERFLQIVPLEKADALSIYTTLVKCLMDKNLQVGKCNWNGF